MSASKTSLPAVLLLGEICHAFAEWDALSAVGELRQIKKGNRMQFLSDCESDVHDGVIAIARTYDSVEITGRFDKELVDALPKSLKFVSHMGAGYDQIDVGACKLRGISVSNTPRVVDAATANTTMYLLLGALRQFQIPSVAIRAGCWRGSMSLGHDLEGKTLGILGMGGIGSAVARRAVAFDLKVQYYNRQPIASESNPTNAEYVPFETLLRTSDAISVHCPLSDMTRHLIGAKEFAMMKDGVVVVNTARGPIIDEQALVDAVKGGKIFGAGLDVYEMEPKVHMGLLNSEKVILLPHISTATFETQLELEILVMKNVRSALVKGELVTPVPE